MRQRSYVRPLLAFLLAGPFIIGTSSVVARDRARPAAAAQPQQRAATTAVDRAAWLYTGSDIPPDAGWQFGRLANGLRFAVRNNGVPPGQVTIRLRVDAGSLMEEPGQSGWAHLIEHLAFRESTYLRSGEARRAWQRLGVTFGSDSNATTGATSTVYQLDIPAASAESVRQSLRYLSGMIRDPVLTDATVNAERPIVLAEKRERDGPDFRVANATRELLFAGQPMGERPVIGSEATLAAATGAGVRSFHDRWYRPERVVIAVAGDLDPAVLEEAIVSNFGDWRARGPAPQEPDFGRPDPSQPNARVIVEPSQPMVANMAWLRPWTRVTDTIAYTQGLMLDSLTTLIINRRLEERARAGGRYLLARVDEDKPARSAWLTNLQVVPLDNDWRTAIGDARAVVAAALATPPSDADIRREFADVEAILARELANAQNEPGTKQADDLLHAVDIGETTTSPDHALAIWRSIAPLATGREIQRRARALFTGDAQRSYLVAPSAIVGGDAALAAATMAPPPRLAAAQDNGRPITIADLPQPRGQGRLVSRTPIERSDFERWELANSVTVLVRDTPIEPNKIRIRVRFGRGRAGLSPMAPNLLWSGGGALVESGIGRFSQSQLDRLTNGRQLGMAFAVDDDAYEFTAETRPEDLQDQLRLLVAKFVAPGWQASPVQRLRAAMLLTYDTARGSPMQVVQSELDGIIFDGDRRFAPPDRAAIDALTPAAFRSFWERQLAAGPIEIQVFGDLSSVQLEPMLLSTFGALPPRPASALTSGATNDVTVRAVPSSPVIVRHNGGDSQAASVLAYPTGGGIADIRTARQLEILAEVFNNRLYERLRDQAGASYSQAVISNWNNSFAHGGYLMVAGLTRPEDSLLLFDAGRAIAAELVAAPVTMDELRRATGPASEQVMRASSGNVFWMVQTEGATRDPRRFAALRSYLVDLTSVTPAQLQALAARYLQPQSAIPLLVLPEGSPLPVAGQRVLAPAPPRSTPPADPSAAATSR